MTTSWSVDGSTAEVGFYLYNDGPAAATGVTASIPVPAGTSFSHYADSTGGTYNSSTGTWTIPGAFASGSSRWIVVVVRIQDPTPGALTASVAATAPRRSASTRTTTACPGAAIISSNACGFSSVNFMKQTWWSCHWGSQH